MYHRATIYGITVFAPSQRHLHKIRRALRALRVKDPNAFHKLARLLKTILISRRATYYNELFTRKQAWLAGHRLVGDRSFPPSYLASHLLHEACHIAQWMQGRQNVGPRAEREAYRIQRNFLKKIGYHQAVAWLDSEYRRQWWRIPPKQATRNSATLRRELQQLQRG